MLVRSSPDRGLSAKVYEFELSLTKRHGIFTLEVMEFKEIVDCPRYIDAVKHESTVAVWRQNTQGTAITGPDKVLAHAVRSAGFSALRRAVGEIT